MNVESKLSILAKIGRELNAVGVTWAVGASLMLFFNGKTDDFRDIDMMTVDRDVETVKNVLFSLGGVVAPPRESDRYKTRHFYEFTVDGLGVDVMAGLVIVRDGVEYDRSLSSDSVVGFGFAEGVPIPLQSMVEWRRNYELMGRTQRVALIDG